MEKLDRVPEDRRK